MMDPLQLSAFLSVAELGSFSKAAEDIHITQSAVSKRIAALEHNLSATLFDRVGHTIQLTEAGRALRPRAVLILQEIEDSQRLIANLDENISGPLKIGTSHHIGLHRLPPVLKKFSHDYTDVELSIQFMDSEEVCDAVLHAKLEVGIVTLPLQPDEELQCLPVWHDPLVIVANADHPLSQMQKVNVTALADYPAILPASGTFTRAVLEQTLAPLGIELKVAMASNYLETIKMLASVGLGWSVLPRAMINDELSIIPVNELAMERTLGIVTHTRRTLSNPARALIELVSSFGDDTFNS